MTMGALPPFYSAAFSFSFVKTRPSLFAVLLAILAGFFAAGGRARGEAVLQYFNTDWREITARMPELAEAGYNAIWVPPPTKGSGGLSVGYDLWDRFDLGGKDQRGTVRTRYGTEGDLQIMIETAHRFGLRVYFDNVMNHNAFDIPGFNAGTSISIYPGFVPEDFHLRITEDGFYRKWDNTRDWNDAWQVQNLGLADLIDIAIENPNTNHGRNEGDDIPKITFVRHPQNPELYLDLDLPISVTNSGGSFQTFTFANKEPWTDSGVAGVAGSAGNGRFDWNDFQFPIGDGRRGNGQHDVGEPSEPFSDTGVDGTNPARMTVAWGFGDNKYNMGNPVPEDVNGLLIRSARWIFDRTHADGYRLDAVKHVPDYFFGQQSGSDKDKSSAGYLGQAQEQFNLTRGFSDWDNHRDSVFNTEQGRDDAMMFGEHLGQPPGYGGYWDSGMRLVDNDLRNELNNKLGNPSNGLQGYDQPGAGGFPPTLGVTHAQSHDNDYAARRELQHAYYLTRAGLPLIYTDGNNHAGTLGASGGAFPRLANTNFLGQYGDNRIPNLLYIHNQFARGYQVGKFADADFIAYTRVDKRENPNMLDEDGAVLLFMMNDNYASGLARSFSTGFPGGAYLYNYSSYGGGFYKYADQMNTAIIPPGGYFAFSWRSPEEPAVFANGAVKPVTILQNGGPVASLTYARKDGKDGDKNFNPYGLPDTNATDYTYSITIPRVTNGNALSFIARADASAEDILLALDGGVDLNSQMTPDLGPQTGELRDNAPAVSTDIFVGYEKMQFVGRQYGEKFAAVNTLNNKFGSAGATTYLTTIGSGTHTQVHSTATNDFSDDGGRNASFIYHDPTAAVAGAAGLQYSESGSAIAIWAKPNAVGAGYRAFLYYTTDSTNPEGAGGLGLGTTQVVEMSYQHNADGGDWWKGQITPQPGGQLRYKIGIYKDTTDGANTAVASVFPSGPAEVTRKLRGLTTFQITNFNATTAKVRPHNDYSEERTGLAEGFHVLRARAFLQRPNRASIYNTFTQTFYYDTQTPGGEIKFPANNGDTVGGQQYGVVVRADPSVTEVWYHIDDSDASNNDSATGVNAGNGGGPEPFTDANNNGLREGTEPFTDINGNGLFDANLAEAWAKVGEASASVAITSEYGREWRFNYRGIPSSVPLPTTATIKVRLLEVSSSRNLTLPPAAAHVTELTRTVNTAGPDLRMFVAFPQQDGQTVGEGYVMKVRFSAALADGLTETQLRNRLSVKIASSESGSSAGAVAQTPQALPIIYNAAPGFHDFPFALPNLYNGVPDFLHTIEVTMNRPMPDADLVTTRAVRAEITQPAVFLSINNPPEIDSAGKKYEIVLPALAAPTAEQRQYVIEVETGAEAQETSIVFDQGAAAASLIEPVATALSGTVAVVQNGSVVTGTGSLFTQQLSVGNSVRIGPATTRTVLTIASDTSLTLSAPYTDATASGLAISRVQPNPRVEGTHKFWRFLWAGLTEGSFTFTANVQADGGPGFEATQTRNATVVFRQLVAQNDGEPFQDLDGDGVRDANEPFTDLDGDTIYDPPDADDDDDGLSDVNEATITALPTTNSDVWTNGQVHVRFAYGQSSPLSPDTDGDGLPDGLEVGWRTAANPPTHPATDTDGDGRTNFIGDLDPPFYNTTDNVGRVPGVNTLSEGGDRAALKGGTATNPNNPDTDGDGIKDGVEDANRNGWVDGDGVSLATNAEPSLTRGSGDANITVKWPNNEMDAGDNWIETSPTKADSDEDGLNDGYGEDKNFNGLIDGDDGDRVYQPGEIWTETDPLKADTDGDGLPDGWETANGLDPLDNGTTSFRGVAAHPNNGAGGNPDGDTIVVEGNTIAYTNALELTNGTDPRTANTGTPPPPGSIIIGPQSPVVVGGVSNAKEFTDWTQDDLIVLDQYDGDGPNNQGADVYHAKDGFDSSRDIVAFYARDGGDTTQGGDGNFYFRVDLRDLVPFAEDGRLDLYVVIDTGGESTGANGPVGEYALPEAVDVATDMKWEAVVAVYSGNNGRVYVDTPNSTNTVSITQTPNASFGVVARDQNAADGFKRAYFNSDLDAVEFSISRKALRDAGWNGFDAGDLNFQVFTTKDGTGNNPIGPGDIGGRNDIRDTIYDDLLASDYYQDQSYIAQPQNSVLRGYFGRTVTDYRGSDRGRRAKLISLLHGNQAIQPGSTTQALINTGAGAGYYRPLDVHQAYAAPFAMHITPTLASSIEWAKADPAGSQLRDGPALNARLKTFAQSGTLNLLGSTFADHVLGYFPADFNLANVNLADDFLASFYGDAHSRAVFWNPERVADSATLAQIGALSFDYTFIDQMRHVLKWFGRDSALGDGGYQLNQIGGVKCFVINDQASGYRFLNTGNGLALALRDLLQRKARSGAQDQVVVLFSPWEDFTSAANADAYDKNIRWLASRPWIQLVTPDQIAAGALDISVPPNGTNDAWGSVNRGSPALAKVIHDFLDHATEENYDFWYNGLAAREEGLRDKRFSIRSGVQLPAGKNFGTLTLGTGLVSETWTQVAAITSSTSELAKLAHGATGAAVFETAFHNQTNNDLSKYSTGAYIYPDVSNQNLAGFAKVAQSQFRHAAVFKRVDAWAATAGTLTTSTAEAADVDLDGENEHLLFNDRVFAVFERLGGRLTGAWVRDIATGTVHQAIGNPLSYAGSETEEEGGANITAGAVGAYRTSGFKDWFAAGAPDALAYVNNLYAATLAANGWTFTSTDGRIAKTITLAPGATLLRATYTLGSGLGPLYVRLGLSPNLSDLLLSGQANLSPLIASATEVGVTNFKNGAPVRAFVRFGGAGNTASFNAAAEDDDALDFDTIQMRNQAQTQQVEIFGGNGMTFALGLQAGGTITQDTDGDGLPDWWERQYGLDPNSAAGANGAAGDLDGDGKSNGAELALGTNPVAFDFLQPQVTIDTDGSGQRTLRFPTQRDRAYRIHFTNDLTVPFTSLTPDLAGTGAEVVWTDDGSQTGGTSAPQRFYKVEVRTLPFE